MAYLPDNEEIQAAAILYLLDTGNEELANALLACRLRIVTWKRDGSLSHVEVAGREPNLQKLKPKTDDDSYTIGSYRMIVNEHTFAALESVLPKFFAKDFCNYKDWIKLRVALGASADYQQELRALIESAGVDEPAIGGLHVSQEGHEYQLKPISIFPVGTFERDAQLCFVLMPFATSFQLVYDQGIKPAIEAQGLTCQRGDDILQAGDIISQIWSSLIKAQLVIADLTGSNGNVLYELGLAHMMGHQAILLAQDISSVPFDLRQQRHIIYSRTESGIQKLTIDLAQAIKAMLAQ